MIGVAIITFVGGGAAVVVAQTREPDTPARSVTRSAVVGPATTNDDDASAMVQATLKHGAPLSEARGDALAAPRRAALDRCADAFRAAPEHRKAELTAFYEVAVAEPGFLVEEPRLARWAKEPPGIAADTDVADARMVLQAQLALLRDRYSTPIDGCAVVRRWKAGSWGADARPPALIAVNRSLLEEQRTAAAHRVALRVGSRRLEETGAPGARRAARLLQAGVLIPTGLDNASPIVAAINEDDAFVE